VYSRRMREPPTVSSELERWLQSEGRRTVGDLIDFFEEKAFAILFIVLLAVPALPLPTGGATHVFEVIAMLAAAQLIVGRKRVWLPQRLRSRELGGSALARLIGIIRRLERFSHPHLRFFFESRSSHVVFGLLVFAGSLAAFLAPPFTGLDTLPSLGVLLLSVGFLLEDAVFVLVGIAVAFLGVVLEIVLGKAAVHGIRSLF
jgi:hypothetical protein